MRIDQTPRSRTRNTAISVDVVRLGRGREVPIRGIKVTARRILEILHKDRAELSIALVGNAEIQALNAEYRAKNEPTDVLSFPVNEMLANGMLLIGDVVISVETAAIQAQQRRRNLYDEVESLLIHGILHNLGYDHERSADDEKVMKVMQRRVAKALR